jgi:hypothetical protein
MVVQWARKLSMSRLDVHSDATAGIVEALIAMEASRIASLVMSEVRYWQRW